MISNRYKLLGLLTSPTMCEHPTSFYALVYLHFKQPGFIDQSKL